MIVGRAERWKGAGPVLLDLHRLRLLRELKHRGTLAAVAAALSYSPSSVSQQLSVLEAEVGVALLEPDLLVQLRLVEQGHAAALLPDLLWGGSAPSVPLLPLPDGGRTRRLFTAVRHGSEGRPAARACRAALQRAVERARCLP